MKKILIAVVFASLLPLTARAQTGPVLGIDLEAALPVSNFGDAAGPGFGALLRYEFTIVTRANVTARAGVVYHLSKNPAPGFSSTIIEIPLLAGLKVAVSPALYVAGELGVFVNHASVSTPFGDASDTNSKLGMTLGAGYRLAALDLRVGLAMIDLGHAGDSLELTGGVGYNF